MIRIVLSFAVLTSFMATAASAKPTASRTGTRKYNTSAPKVAPPKSGWSLVNGVWTHSEGYQYVKGRVVRVGTQTHQKPPAPPTKAELDAAVKKPAAKTPAQTTADKAAERERNLAPRPAPQTGTHL